MTDSNVQEGVPSDSLQGRVFQPASREELAEAVELAFDYRGDVTLQLSSGESLHGYLFNRDAQGADPCIELFPAGEPACRTIPYREIAAIAFTGPDTASGKSWSAWVSKKESQRQAESAQVAEDARARGHL